MAAPPLNVTIAPVAAKAKGNAFDRFMRAHKPLQKYKVAIQQWAGEYGVPAIWVAATVAFEGGYDKQGNPLNQPNSKGTGFGLAQINPKVWFGKTFTPTGETITQDWASQPGNAINFAAWLLASQAGTQGTLANTYRAAYNPGYKGSGPEALLKGFGDTSFGSVGATPSQRAAGGVATAQGKAANVVVQQAALGKALIGQFKTTKRALDPIYLAYTGKPASAQAVQGYIDNPTSTYQIELNLADPKRNPQIFKSPVWQTNQGRYASYYQDVFGPTAKVPQQALLYGVVHSLDETAFKHLLTKDQLPGQAKYATSEDYKGRYASYQSVYTNIYGLPDMIGKSAIKQAVTKGWTQDQWTNYLRAQPEYSSSGEYKVRAVALAKQMGLIPDQSGQTALQPQGAQTPVKAASQVVGQVG